MTDSWQFDMTGVPLNLALQAVTAEAILQVIATL